MNFKIGRILSILAILFVVCLHATAQEDTPANDKDIEIVHYEELNYPPLAHTAHIEGVVVVRVILNERGGVVKAVALSGHPVLIPSCVANAQKWKFQPTVKTALIVYNFTIPDVRCGYYTGFFTFRPPNFVTVTGCPLTVEP
jgi:hypothetical protein